MIGIKLVTCILSRVDRQFIKTHLFNKSLGYLFWALVPVCIASGCMNLDDVAQLTKLADNAQQSLPAVVADIPASCERQNLLLNDIPSDERPASLVPQDCKAYVDVADHVTKDQTILIAYFDALGKLASNTPLSYGKTIDANVATIGKLPGLSKDTITASNAAQKIGKVLGDAVTQAYRQRKVRSIIENTDDAVQELTSDLKNVIAVDYIGILANEREAIDAYYGSPIAAAGKSQRLVLVVVQHQYDGDLMALQSRKNAATAYGKVMVDLAALHAKLKQEAEKKASLRDIAKEVGPNVSDLKDAISAVRTELK